MGFHRTSLALAVVLGHTGPILGYCGMPPAVIQELVCVAYKSMPRICACCFDNNAD